MSRTRPPVRLILDRSALVAYLAGSMHVGEVLHEVIDDEEVLFGVPVVVAAEALTMVSGKDRALVHQLFAVDACELLPLASGDLLELTYWRDTTGRIDLAAAALAAFVYDGSVLTAEGPRYGGEVPLIDIPA